MLLYDERTDLPGLAALDAQLVRTLTAGVPTGAQNNPDRGVTVVVSLPLAAQPLLERPA